MNRYDPAPVPTSSAPIGTQMTGRNINTNEEANVESAITLNSSTSTTITAADPNRNTFIISNPSSQDVWLKFQAASVDNVKKGVMLFKRSSYEMPPDNIYLGEISGITVSGSADVYITEY